MQAKKSILQRLRQLSKHQIMRIGLGIAVLLALILILWPAAG